MAILTRVSALFVVALAITGTSAGTIQARTTASKNCSKNEFSFARGNKSCCLPTSAPSNPPAPPAEHECPKSGYYWHSGQKFCAPHTPPRDDDEPNCPSNCKWNHDEQYCEPTKPTKPATTSKPTPSPTKGNDQCGKNEWSFSGGNKKCCLPHSPPSNPPSPPSGHQCPPKGYYWHSDKKFCAPHSPPSGPPECPKDCKWNKDDQYCQPNNPPHPQPTHGWGNHHYKRNLKSRSQSLCPTGLTACPVSSLAGADIECLDTKAELTSCGGCATLGQGQDCTAIEGAWNVGCEAGKCAVYTCQGGFTRSLDGKSCIAL